MGIPLDTRIIEYAYLKRVERTDRIEYLEPSTNEEGKRISVKKYMMELVFMYELCDGSKNLLTTKHVIRTIKNLTGQENALELENIFQTNYNLFVAEDKKNFSGWEAV